MKISSCLNIMHPTTLIACRDKLLALDIFRLPPKHKINDWIFKKAFLSYSMKSGKMWSKLFLTKQSFLDKMFPRMKVLKWRILIFFGRSLDKCGAESLIIKAKLSNQTFGIILFKWKSGQSFFLPIWMLLLRLRKRQNQPS